MPTSEAGVLTDVHPVILAAGRGTRLQRVVSDVPKPMVNVCGRPFVEWVVRYLAACGFRAATISTGYLGELIERHFAAEPVAGFAVNCVREPRPLGTAGGFLAAANGNFRTPHAWLVLNGDSLIFSDFEAQAARLEADECVSGVGRRASSRTPAGMVPLPWGATIFLMPSPRNRTHPVLASSTLGFTYWGTICWISSRHESQSASNLMSSPSGSAEASPSPSRSPTRRSSTSAPRPR